MSSGWSSHNDVDPSMSVRRNVTVPAGSANDPGAQLGVTAGSPHDSAFGVMVPNVRRSCCGNIPRAGEKQLGPRLPSAQGMVQRARGAASVAPTLEAGAVTG